MKICDVTQFYSPRSGGVKRYVSEKRRFVESQTTDSHYLIIPGPETAYQQDGRLHTFTVRSPRIDRTSRYRALLNTSHVRHLLHDIRPDIIESGDPYHLAWTALRAGREQHIPVVGFYHSHFPEAYLRTVLKYGGPWLRDLLMAYAEDYIVRLYTEFAATLVPSDHLSKLLQSWGVHNAVTMHLGVDTESFCPGPKDIEWRRQLEVPDEAQMLLYVGRLAPEKNIVTLLKSFQILHRHNPNLWLVVVGDGPLRRHLPAVREATSALVWRSYVGDSPSLARYYRAADLFVHPGVHETFGLVTLESQAAGCPVVGIRGTNMDPNVFSALDLWATQNTPKSLAQAINRMLSQNLPEIGLKASVEVRARFSWNTVFSNLWAHYHRVKNSARFCAY